MKMILLAFLAIMVTASVTVAQDTPIDPQLYKYFRRNPVTTGVDGARRVRARYVITSTSASGKGAAGSYSLGAVLPARAVITRSFYEVTSAITGEAGATIAFSCEDANNIKTATDMELVAPTTHAAHSFVEGASTGTAATFVRGIAAQCVVTATVASGAYSTGSFDLYIDYVVETE